MNLPTVAMSFLRHMIFMNIDFFNYSILCNDRCCHGATYLVQNQSDNKFIRYGEGSYDYDYDLINKINCPR